jgi:hypothetical protein
MFPVVCTISVNAEVCQKLRYKHNGQPGNNNLSSSSLMAFFEKLTTDIQKRLKTSA